jgi:hypothetical protein
VSRRVLPTYSFPINWDEVRITWFINPWISSSRTFLVSDLHSIIQLDNINTVAGWLWWMHSIMYTHTYIHICIDVCMCTCISIPYLCNDFQSSQRYCMCLLYSYITLDVTSNNNNNNHRHDCSMKEREREREKRQQHFEMKEYRQWQTCSYKAFVNVNKTDRYKHVLTASRSSSILMCSRDEPVTSTYIFDEISIHRE